MARDGAFAHLEEIGLAGEVDAVLKEIAESKPGPEKAAELLSQRFASLSAAVSAARRRAQPVSSGYHLLRSPHVNKFLSYTHQEREEAKLTGLVPAGTLSLDAQVDQVMARVRSIENRLDKYVWLATIQDCNEPLFSAVLMKNMSEVMPFVYTPTVGDACINWSALQRHCPRGLYISMKEKGSILKVLDNWPVDDVKCIVVTDGERILGLGDQGADGMGIPVGKLALYTACAGLNPAQCLPIVMDMGTNNQKKLDDPAYVGVREKRVPAGEQVDSMVAELFDACHAKYGKNVLIQFEDWGNGNSFRLLETFQPKGTCFNDDIQGTASVALAGLLASERATGKKLIDHTFVFLGAGGAGVGIAELIADALVKEGGMKKEEARKQIWLVDSKGLVVKDRKSGGLVSHKLPYAHEHAEIGTLLEAVKELKATALIGVSTSAGAFNEEVIQAVCANTDRPIVFALSNPTSVAECTAEQAITYSKGKAVFASGSPFPPVEYGGRTHTTGQGNNAYVFPGVGLGVVSCGASVITDEDMVTAATALADCVVPEQLEKGCMYPPLDSVRDVSVKVAAAVAKANWDRGTAGVPKPDDVEAHVRASMWSPF